MVVEYIIGYNNISWRAHDPTLLPTLSPTQSLWVAIPTPRIDAYVRTYLCVIATYFLLLV